MKPICSARNSSKPSGCSPMPTWTPLQHARCCWSASPPWRVSCAWGCSRPWISGLRRAIRSPLWILVNRPTTCVIIWLWLVVPIRCSQTTRSPACTRPAWACRERSITPQRLLSSPQLPPAKRWSTMTAPRKRWPSSRATELSLHAPQRFLRQEADRHARRMVIEQPSPTTAVIIIIALPITERDPGDQAIPRIRSRRLTSISHGLERRGPIRHRLARYVEIGWNAVPSPALPQRLNLPAVEMDLRIAGPRSVVVIQQFLSSRPQNGCDQGIPRVLAVEPGPRLIPSPHKHRLSGGGVSGKLALVSGRTSQE